MYVCMYNYIISYYITSQYSILHHTYTSLRELLSRGSAALQQISFHLNLFRCPVELRKKIAQIRRKKFGRTSELLAQRKKFGRIRKNFGKKLCNGRNSEELPSEVRKKLGRFTYTYIGRNSLRFAIVQRKKFGRTSGAPRAGSAAAPG